MDTKMESRKADMFKVLSVTSRIKIIDLLKQRGAMGANELANALGITPSAVSQHLKVLRYAGLVRNERKGYWLPYQVDPEALSKCHDLLSEVCTCGCKGTGRLREAELEKAPDKLDLLKQYERELQKQLEDVKARIQKIEFEE
jgi:DNA-binding transcriptional ArsR family regulator